MKRSRLVFPILLVMAALAVPAVAQQQDHQAFQLVESTISDIHKAFQSEGLTPEQLVRMYLARIAAYDQSGDEDRFALNSYMHVNEQAIQQAAALTSDDSQNDSQQQCGEDEDGGKPLFGIPVIVKDNIDTKGMPTTAGSVALGGSLPPQDAFITHKLRCAGAIILGKGTLTEFANFLTIGMPTGYSSQLRLQLFEQGGALGRVGYGFNPYDPVLIRETTSTTAGRR